jgi:predicted RNA-binding Zn-ribbon protein involved in translation (DUF1610 family)
MEEISDPQQAESLFRCPDCQTAMVVIKLIDAGKTTGLELPHRELQYAAGDAAPSGWTGRFPIAGVVRARMCPECGRITLHGEPARKV